MKETIEFDFWRRIPVNPQSIFYSVIKCNDLNDVDSS